MISALLLFLLGFGIYFRCLPKVTLKVDSVVIRQEEAMPEFKVYAEYSGSKNVVLDEKTQYKVTDLVEELNRGEGYSLTHEANNIEEGVYPLTLSFEKELKERLLYQWQYKIQYQIEDGTLQVLNKYGDWEEGKFKFLEGHYASGWTNLGPDTYYFGEDGKRVTGVQNIGGVTYHFKENGVFDMQKNKVNPNRPMIALTFDDGPGKYTMQLLQQLEAYHARATFFMVGRNVPKYPDAVRKMKEIGCELGNHSTNHPNLTKHAPEVVHAEIETTNIWLEQTVGERATLVRPPYGAYNEVIQSLANAPLILWSMDTRDWESRNPVLVRDMVLTNVKDGDIILLHDIHDTTLQASMELIPLLVERGYQLVTVSELAKARGVTLNNGQVYYSFGVE